MDNYYNILELSSNATQEEIKTSYRKLAKIYHPDMNNDETSDTKFKTINEAYEIIGNIEKRRQYDRKNATFSDSFHNQSPSDDMFSHFGFSTPTRKKKEFKTKFKNDINNTINVSLQNAYNGTSQSYY